MFPIKTKKVLQSLERQPDRISGNIDQTSNARGQNGKCESQEGSKQRTCLLGIGLLI